jgi:hypothetical protein
LAFPAANAEQPVDADVIDAKLDAESDAGEVAARITTASRYDDTGSFSTPDDHEQLSGRSRPPSAGNATRSARHPTPVS